MGNSCKTAKKKDTAKKHFEEDKKQKDDDNEEEEGTKNNPEQKNTIKTEDKKDEPIKYEDKIEDKKEDKIEDKKEEKIEEKKEEKKEKKKKTFKVKEEKENKNNDVDNFSDEDCTCNLRLEITLEKAPNDNEFKIELYEYKNARREEKKKIAETESKSNLGNKNIKFENEVIIPFHFSQIQPLEFLIKNNTSAANVTISKTLGEIVGSLRQTYRENILNGITFEVKAILNDELNKQCSFNIGVSGALTGMKIGYSITSLGNQYDPINELIYDSETTSHNTKINFNEISIPINKLASDENLDDNIIEITFKDVNHADELGKYKSSINQLFEKEIDFDLKGNKKASILCKKKNFYSLLDYLERDLHLTTTLFIDFSEFNEANTHHIVNNETTFEKLMENFIDILTPYNEDLFFHIFGYGFKLKQEFDGGEYNPNMFPINQKLESPSVEKNSIKRVYYDFLNSINFSNKKTDINLIIKNNNDKVKEELEEDYIREYNIFLLFVNNDIINEKDFINELIISSTLPISIIIVGLGKDHFTKLENIDTNFLNLTNEEGMKAKRKCIKFISFNKCLKNFQNTVKKSLISIPDEMIEYLTLKNIVPNV